MTLIESSAKKSKVHTQYYITHNGKKIRVPGVSGIKNVMNMPALYNWYNELGLQGIVAADYVDDLAGAGTCCHRMCELYCKGEKDPSKHEDMNMFTKDQINHAETGYIKFLEWVEATGFYAIDNELQLVSNTLFYGGTLDIYGVMKKRNKKVLVDIKTSKSVFDDHKTQVAGGYGLLCKHNNEGSHIPVDEIWILRLGRNENEGYQSIKITGQEIRDHQRRFIYCRLLYEMNKLCNSYKPISEKGRKWSEYIISKVKNFL